MSVFFSPRLMMIFSFFIQASCSSITILVSSHLLSGEEYINLSLSLSLSLFISIFLFEWIRISASRHYKFSDVEIEIRQRRSLYICYVISCVAGILALLLFFALDTNMFYLIFPAYMLSIMQGASDIHLVMLRFRANYSDFMRTQTTRAILQTTSALLAAFCFRTSLSTVLGMATAQFVALLWSFWRDKNLRYPLGLGKQNLLNDLRTHAVYGFPATIASAASISTLIALRFAIPKIMNGQNASGVLLSIDLMQKPFNVALAAVHSIYYPSLVLKFDDGNAFLAYRKMLLVELATILAIFIMTSAFFVLVDDLLVPYDRLEGFRSTYMLTLVIFSLRCVLTNITYTPFHLYKMTSVILKMSFLEAALYAVAIGVSVLFRFSVVQALSACSVASVLVIVTSLYMSKNLSMTRQ